MWRSGLSVKRQTTVVSISKSHGTNLIIAPTLSYVTTYTSKSSNTRWGSLPRHHNSDYWLFDFQNAASVRLDDSKAVHKGYCSRTLTLPAQKSPGDYRYPNTSQIFDNSSIFVCTMQTARKSLQVAAKLLTDNHITLSVKFTSSAFNFHLRFHEIVRTFYSTKSVWRYCAQDYDKLSKWWL